MARRQPPDTAGFRVRIACLSSPHEQPGSEFVLPACLLRTTARVITGCVSHCPMGPPSHMSFITCETLVGPRYSMSSPGLFSARPRRVVFLMHILVHVFGVFALLLFYLAQIFTIRSPRCCRDTDEAPREVVLLSAHNET